MSVNVVGPFVYTWIPSLDVFGTPRRPEIVVGAFAPVLSMTMPPLPTPSRSEITLPEIVSGPPEVMITSSPAPMLWEIVTDLLPSMTRIRYSRRAG